MVSFKMLIVPLLRNTGSESVISRTLLMPALKYQLSLDREFTVVTARLSA